MSLTQLECFRATVQHRTHEGFLYYASFTPDLKTRIFSKYGFKEDREISEHFRMFVPGNITLKAPEGTEKPDFSVYFSDREIPEGACINNIGVLEIPGSMYHFKRYVSPLRNAEKFEDLESFPYPNVEGYTDDHMADKVRSAHEQGKVAVCWVGHMYEAAWQIRGYEEFLMDMLLRPEWCEYILDRLMESNKVRAIAAAKAGADYLRTGDDVANQNTLMFSKEQWEKFMKSRWAEVFKAARSIKPDIDIWYHSDGNIEDIIPDLIEIGVTILNPLQPECLDPLMVKEKYGDKIVVDGAIGTQTTMPFGTPDDVKKIVRERVDTLGKDGAYIISPTHVLEPEVPIENIEAFFETAKEK